MSEEDKATALDEQRRGIAEKIEATLKEWGTSGSYVDFAGQLLDIISAFGNPHIHKNAQDGTDACGLCGKDLRDEIHLRVGQEVKP